VRPSFHNEHPVTPHTIMTRREAIKTTVVGAATAAAALSELSVFNAAAQGARPFQLPPLPYAVDALEPYIDARTMEVHHDKHHAGYVRKLNAAVEATPALQGKGLEEMLGDLEGVPESARTAIRNNGGGHYNHTLFWRGMKRQGGGGPKGDLATAIDKQFGSFSQFQDQFTKAALTRFGSGWAWLSDHHGEHLHIESTPNQDTPLSSGHTPLLGIDVWEHAYYLNYQNRRADYIAAWFNVIDWDDVSERFQNLKG
jgi:superoxide dismutase, Fe-Mn family